MQKKTKKTSNFIENRLLGFGGGYLRGHFIIPIWRRIPQSVVQCLALLLILTTDKYNITKQIIKLAELLRSS